MGEADCRSSCRGNTPPAASGPPLKKMCRGSPESVVDGAAAVGEIETELYDLHPLIELAHKFGKEVMDKNDGSHDFQHALRVWRIARSLWRKKMNIAGKSGDEGKNSLDRTNAKNGDNKAKDASSTSLEDDRLALEISALLHDIDDSKYASSEKEKHIERFWEEAERNKEILDTIMEQNPPTSLTTINERTQFIIDNLSYHTELKYNQDFPAGTYEAEILAKEPMLAYAQDADRLDAIGAIGVARTFCFGGSRSRALYSEESLRLTETFVPDSKMYNHENVHTQSLQQQNSSTSENTNKNLTDTLAHFYEKLLMLKDRIKTTEGKAMAQQRHQFMETFIAQLKGEVRGEL
ncbi:unnamed protein product [Amoebophrya sp. A25]|nr:unnamed protein product [Amoebophrya sp. A25]|eukprot:GSA25T00027418001.1